MQPDFLVPLLFAVRRILHMNVFSMCTNLICGKLWIHMLHVATCIPKPFPIERLGCCFQRCFIDSISYQVDLIINVILFFWKICQNWGKRFRLRFRIISGFNMKPVLYRCPHLLGRYFLGCEWIEHGGTIRWSLR